MSSTMETTTAIVKPGEAIHMDMTNDEYHAHPGWSHSQLKHLPDEPEAFEWKFILKRELFTKTRPMVCGSALHEWLLEGIEPTKVPADFLTKAGAMKSGGWRDMEVEFPGIPVLKADEMVGLKYARESCYADEEIRAYLETTGEVEHSLFSVDPETELHTRVRLDKLCHFTDGLVCLDLKYSANVDDRWIDQQVAKMAYYSQAGMYWEHVERAYETPQSWVFLFVKNGPPYTARLSQLLLPDVELGIRHTHIQLRDLKVRLDANDWQGDGHGSMGVITLPSWLWEKNPEPIEAHSEFIEFSETNNTGETSHG